MKGAGTRPPVLLVSMPFGPLAVPSLGLALLKAGLRRTGIESRVIYFTIRFAESIGADLYASICDETSSQDMVGEWIFSDSLFGRRSEAEDRRYLELVRRRDQPHPTVGLREPPLEDLLTRVPPIRDSVEPFLDDCLAELLALEPSIVGFTTIFQQHLAALSLAKRIKEARSDIHVLFGGANCEGVMGRELVRQFPFVDVAVSGEGDLVVPELVTRLLDGRSVDDLPGVSTGRNTALDLCGVPAPTAPRVEHLDRLPTPDFDDYFGQLEASGVEPAGVRLLFETSRGCWWGEKSHCTFCGLNGTGMKYRSKSTDRALDELLELTRRHPGLSLEVVDNILDMRYFRDFLPALVELDLGLELFFEVKANLKKRHLRLLRQAGVTAIQPGIESFSDAVLRLMGKGVTGLQNVQLLKWCREVGVLPNWNIIWGFPGEPVGEYERMVELLPLISHLHPPAGAFPLRLDRFSPNFERGHDLGFRNVMPVPSYGCIYPLPEEAVANLAYYFTFEYDDGRHPASYVQPLVQAVERWKQCYARSALVAVDRGERLLIVDSRPASSAPLQVLEGMERRLYLACDEITTPRQLLALSAGDSGAAGGQDEIRTKLDAMVDSGVMLRQGERYLALAVLGETSC